MQRRRYQRPRPANRIVQNDAPDWQFWLRAGVLCVAKENVFATSRLEHGFLTTFTDRLRPEMGAVLRKGEHCICLGELVRRKVKDTNSYAKSAQVVIPTWYFLFPTGTYVAEPYFFVEGDTSDDV